GMLADPALAEDVAQEVFLRAWRHAGAYDPRRGAVRTWLMTITRNLAIDALRMRRSLPVDPQSVVLTAVSSEPDPAEVAALGSDVERLHRAMADLPEPQRRALSLAVHKGLTMEEIGRVEAIPTGTAKTRIRAAMMKLRTVMVDEAES
ncbi:MAG TPA: sigma-70 family RNA polymerase sigma factor, partial [Acidimicrobiales bacterium]|nr:sigma-70 family RNA polymerase sigma factor [Acidimicrobiales bacterium]